MNKNITIRNVMGRRLPYLGGYIRRQLEIDCSLSRYGNVNFLYDYYEYPTSKIDHLLKRVIKYPRQLRKTDKNVINHITAQHLADLALILNRDKTVICCHDIWNFINRRGYQDAKLVNKFRLRGLKKCNNLIAISEFTKKEMVEKLGLEEDNITVIRNGVNRDIFYPIEVLPGNVLNVYCFGFNKTILHVGTEEGRKNFINLLYAFYYVKHHIKNIKLIRVGKPQYMDLIKRLNLQHDIIYLSNITNENLNMLYNQCDLFVFPSTYEGFGFPGIEANSVGCPLLCSDIPIFKEIYHNSALFFNPEDSIELANLILKVIDDKVTKNKLSRAGIENAKKNTWDIVADKYYKYMMELV